MRSAFFITAFSLLLLLAGCASSPPPAATASYPNTDDFKYPRAPWRQILDDRLPLYGHRNCIVIADSAYPAQTRGGIETVVTGADQIQVLKVVLDAIDHSKHVTPIVYTDAELKYVPEKDAPGVDAYRRQLADVLGHRQVNAIPHIKMIAKLDETGETFKVLILKTTMTVPYTSVFLQLDCAYWGPDAEKRLREAMPAGEK